MWFDVLPYTYHGNNIRSVTDWMKKVDKYNNGSTTISVKFDVYGLLYHNIPLKYVTNVVILNMMYSDPRKKRTFCDNLMKKETNKKKYIDNYVHAKIDPKLQNMSKVQVLRMVLHEGMQKNIQGGFVEFQKKSRQFYFDWGNSKKNWMEL